MWCGVSYLECLEGESEQKIKIGSMSIIDSLGLLSDFSREDPEVETQLTSKLQTIRDLWGPFVVISFSLILSLCTLHWIFHSFKVKELVRMMVRQFHVNWSGKFFSTNNSIEGNNC